VIPFYISFQMEGDIESQRMRFAVEWLWGAIGLGITSYEGRSWTSFLLGRRPVYRRERKPEPKEKRKVDLSKLPKSSELSDIYKRGTRLLDALLKSASLKNLRCRFKFVLGDPAATGMALGAYHAFMGAVSSWMDHYSVTVEPTFHEEVLEGQVSLGIRLRLMRLVIPFIQLMRLRSIRRMMRS